MIESKDLMHLSFLKKSRYTGSDAGMRYLLEKKVEKAEDGSEQTLLRACCWPEPYCYDKTEETLKKEQTFDFSEDGIEEARMWLNRQGEEQIK